MLSQLAKRHPNSRRESVRQRRAIKDAAVAADRRFAIGEELAAVGVRGVKPDAVWNFTFGEDVDC
jgi:hypothetical protein